MATVRIPYNDDYAAHNPAPRGTGVNADALIVNKCEYKSDALNPNPTLEITVYFSSSEFDAKFRFKYEISTDNFNTILKSGYSNECMAKHDSNPSFLNMYGEYVSINPDPQKKYGTAQAKNIGIPLRNTRYKTRIRFEKKADGASSWETGSFKDYLSYAPIGFAITPPANVYLNSLNTYGASIPADVESVFSVSTCYGNTENPGYTSGHTPYTPANSPVRNADPPYITSGTATANIYWCPQINAAARENGDTSASYSWTCRLIMPDPDGGNFSITVGQATASGTATWLETDDHSMISTSGLSIVDLSGAYDTYGYVLRNINAKIRMDITVTPHYGAQYGVTAYGAIELYYGREAGSFTKTVDVPITNDSFTVKAYVDYGSVRNRSDVNSITFSPTYYNYAIPSFPVLAVHRCNEDGSSNDNGNYVRIEWAVSIKPIGNQNSKSLKINHSQGTTEYNPLDSYTQQGILIVAASIESSYTFTFTLQDDFNSIVRTLTVSTAGVIRDVLFGGNGVAYGKVAEKQKALEISPFWDLIAYKMKLNGTDMVAWVKEMIARMTAIEQFASNLGSTSQYQVTFYNDTQLIDRQWVRSGNDATAPSENPTRESTETRTYAFVGWALTNGATTANPNALKNITSYRSIYAAFSSSIRYYSVFFKNLDTILQTITNLQYHGNASYSGSTPTDPDGGTFVGWRPSGRYIEETKNAVAQFYYDQEITDTWEEIVAACASGTYIDKYKPGNWKMLDLGAQGNIKMRVKGIKMHYGPGMKKLPMSWEADTALATKKQMNSVRTPTEIWGESDVDGWTYQGMEEHYVYDEFAYIYNASGKGNSANNKAEATIEIKALAATTVNLRYKKSSSAGSAYITWAANGTAKQTNKSLTTSGVTVAGDAITLTANQTLTITVETYCTEATAYCYLQLLDAPTSYVQGQSAIVITSFTTNHVKDCVGLTAGEGNIGGFARSELLAYLQNTIKPLFPAALLAGLKRARLNCASTKSVRESPNYQFVPNDAVETDIFIPSSDEIVGANEGNTKGVDVDMRKYQYRKKGNTSSANGYWCRDTYNSENRFSYITGYSSSDGSASRGSTYPDSTYAVYICFCT